MKYLVFLVILVVGCTNVDTGEVYVKFCPECEDELLKLINNSTEIYCAFYDLDLKNVVDALNYKKAKVYLDAYVPGLYNYKVDKKKALMHNK